MMVNEKREPTLYYLPPSWPCRSVLLVAAALKLKLNLKVIDVMKGEQNHPGFVKINPHHCIPTLADNEFVMSESRAICIYLVEKYGRNDALYPKNPKTRATINQLIYFDMGTLYPRFNECYMVPFMTGTPADEKKVELLNEAIGFLDDFLGEKKFFVGYKFTIADLILISGISTLEAVGYDFSAYPNVANWLQNMKEIAPGYDQNEAGLEMLKSFMTK